MSGQHGHVADTPADRCRAAVASVEHGLSLSPRKFGREVDEAVRLVAELRDELIERLRAEPSGALAGRRRAALSRVNAALSLVVGVEYPVSGVRRAALEQARDALRGLLDRGLE